MATNYYRPWRLASQDRSVAAFWLVLKSDLRSDLVETSERMLIKKVFLITWKDKFLYTVYIIKRRVAVSGENLDGQLVQLQATGKK